MPNLTQLLNQIVRAAVWRFVWSLPQWVIWSIVGFAFVYALLFARR
jgi:choline-glycine betaine transporter